MKRFFTFALIVAGLAVSTCAQRSGSRGGFSGHSGSAFHGGFASHGFAGSPRSSGNRYIGPSHSIQRSSSGHFGGSPAHTGDRRDHRPIHPHPRVGRSYVGMPWTGWVSPYLLGYSDDSYSGVSSDAPSNTSEASDAQNAEPEQPETTDRYQPGSYQPPSSNTSGNEEAVTLVFKDGRPSEQVHNYLLTRTTLFILDERHRAIPTDQLDLIATAKVNEDVGVDFRLPAAAR